LNKPSPALLLEAIGLHQRGNVAEAAARYSAILGHEPKNIDALFFLGIAAGQQGQFTDSSRHLRRVIKMAPKHAGAHMYLGLAQAQLGGVADALQSFDRAILHQPDLFDAYLHRANVLAANNRLAEAIATYDRALAVKPDFVEGWFLRGNALAALERHDDAVASFDHALALKADVAEVFVNRGNSLRALDRFDDAIASYERAIAIRPDFAEAHYSIGLAYEDLCRHDLALQSFDRAIALRAFDGDALRMANAHLRRAAAYHTLDRLADGLRDVEQALRLAPDADEVLYTISFIDRLHGRWLEAWPKHERRLNFRLLAPPALANWPMWSGEPLAHEVLLIKGEEGLGDQINFSRYVPHLASLGYRVAVWPDAKLAPLLQTLSGVAHIISGEEEVAALGDLRWVYMLSLPHILRTSPETIPQTTPYLRADPARVAAWRQRLGGGFKVGIHWQGNPRMTQDRIRSAPLAAFQPVADIPGVRLISLQKQPGASQIAAVSFCDRIETPLDDADISAEATLETAALLMNLDVVVTCDSMIPHLAGALERPVYLATMRVPDWRWQRDGQASPWYPSMRLFRQPAREVWDDVFHRLAAAVRAMAENPTK
jgi:tetratricopeptide (TPR) repeat protein